MSAVWHIVVSLEFVLAFLLLLKSRRSVTKTTLKSAWNWSVLAMVAWAFCCLADLDFALVSTEVADLAWHAAAVFSLTPAIAVLGSRRPGTRVWAGFILVPMLLVLGWPIGAQLLHGTEFRGLQLESPQVAAYTLVLVMGVGNYCGTRFTLSALIFGSALLILVVSSSVICPSWLADRPSVRFWSLAAVSLSICVTTVLNRPSARTQFDRVWFDFFDSFGIVWGRRIQDRVNYLFTREQLPIRLELDGFVWADASNSPAIATGTSAELTPRESTEGELACKPDPDDRIKVEARVEQIVRWLLRRFVDPPWIDQRLGHAVERPVPQLTIDS